MLADGRCAGVASSFYTTLRLEQEEICQSLYSRQRYIIQRCTRILTTEQIHHRFANRWNQL